MNEFAKTGIFLGAGVLAMLLAWASYPSLSGSADATDPRNQDLFPKFTDPLKATSLEIVAYDEAKAQAHTFKVRQKGGVWSIPSHSDYPADAQQQMGKAGAAMVKLKILDVVSQAPGDHGVYGVLDPASAKLGAKGVGMRVTLQNKSGEKLAALIVGKEVEGSEGLRYVRKVGQDSVYTVKLDTAALTTKFHDWIEKDLLKINAWDITRLQIRDYSVDELRGTVTQGGDVTLAYNDMGDPKWTLVKDEAVQNGQTVESGIPEGMELDAEKLDQLKSALDELEIVDVAPKPEGLSGDLAASADFTQNQEAVESLQQCGFYVAQVTGRGQAPRVELVSNEGETRVTTKEGVEYILRFGEIAIDSTGGTAQGANRYIFVTTQFDKSGIEAPKLEQAPAVPEGQEPTAEQKAEKERIDKEYKRLQEEYDGKVKKGEERVAELNRRFAKWYYVISDEVYKKIRLDHDALYRKPKPADGAPAGPGAPSATGDFMPSAPVLGPDAGAPVTPPTEEQPAAQQPPAETPAPETPAPETPAAETPAPETPAAEQPGAMPGEPAAESPPAEPAEPAPATPPADTTPAPAVEPPTQVPNGGAAPDSQPAPADEVQGNKP